jgi:hypothetical protein
MNSRQNFLIVNCRTILILFYLKYKTNTAVKDTK